MLSSLSASVKCGSESILNSLLPNANSIHSNQRIETIRFQDQFYTESRRTRNGINLKRDITDMSETSQPHTFILLDQFCLEQSQYSVRYLFLTLRPLNIPLDHFE